jgi:hypothetical protein
MRFSEPLATVGRLAVHQRLMHTLVLKLCNPSCIQDQRVSGNMATCLRCAAMQAAGLGSVTSSPRPVPQQVVCAVAAGSSCLLNVKQGWFCCSDRKQHHLHCVCLQVTISRVVARPTHFGRQTCGRTVRSQRQQLRATVRRPCTPYSRGRLCRMCGMPEADPSCRTPLIGRCDRAG